MLFQPKNVNKFNCYSYAVNHRSEWLTIPEAGHFTRKYGSTWDFLEDVEGSINELAKYFVVEEILLNFPEYVIVDKKDIKKGTRLIAFKMADNDYHFMKRFPNGHWFHKRGGLPIEPIKTKSALAKEWSNGRYYSKTIFLGYKEDY